METLENLAAALESGRLPVVKNLVSQLLSEGMSAKEILDGGLIEGMDRVGEKFKNGKLFVPEVLLAARCMQAGCDLLKPYLGDGGATTGDKVIIGTVFGDRHDIGKNLCKMMLSGKGLDVIDLGVNVPASKFIDEAVKNNAKVICLSALLTTTMPEMKKVVDAAEEAGIRDKVTIMVGGAPVTEEFAKSIGADIYTSDAAACAEKAALACSAS